MSDIPPAAAGLTTSKTSKRLHIALWVAQGLLALLFTMAGILKTTTPIPELAARMVWVSDLPESLPRIAGTVELFGAVGLVLPALTRIKTWLTPLAASGLVVVMALAIPINLSHGLLGDFVFNLALMGALAFVAWGRFRKAPISPR